MDMDDILNMERGRREFVNAGILPAIPGPCCPDSLDAPSTDIPSTDIPSTDWPLPTATTTTNTRTEVPLTKVLLPVAPSERVIAALLSRGYGLEGALVKGSMTGPTVTTVMVELHKGAKASSLASREADLARDLGVDAVRVLGSMPGYPGCLGLEIPNKARGSVGFRDTLMAYRTGSCVLPVVLGATSFGTPTTLDLAGMPHLLVAGTTGSGKSVFLHSAICSLASLLKPAEVEIHLIDPKRVEFRDYRDLPHLGSTIATEPHQAQQMLLGLAREMDGRYAMLEKEGCRDIASWNLKHARKMPYQVLVVDEFGDLMMSGGDPRAIEDAIIRIAQKARAVGIHAILATQKLTGVVSTKIRDNFPTRITFKVADERPASKRNTFGPEDLIGKGDLLLSGITGAGRYQAALLDPDTVKQTVLLSTAAPKDSPWKS